MSPTRSAGFPFTIQLAIDLLGALPRVLASETVARVRKDLLVYVFSGERDPVGGNLKGLIDALKAAGFTGVTTRIYPGARHETLNETNRDGVMRDLVAWLDGVVAGSRAASPPRFQGFFKSQAPEGAIGRRAKVIKTALILD